MLSDSLTETMKEAKRVLDESLIDFFRKSRDWSTPEIKMLGSALEDLGYTVTYKPMAQLTASDPNDRDEMVAWVSTTTDGAYSINYMDRDHITMLPTEVVISFEDALRKVVDYLATGDYRD